MTTNNLHESLLPYKQGDYEYERAMRYIDDMCDSRVDSIVRYEGEPITIKVEGLK